MRRIAVFGPPGGVGDDGRLSDAPVVEPIGAALPAAAAAEDGLGEVGRGED